MRIDESKRDDRDLGRIAGFVEPESPRVREVSSPAPDAWESWRAWFETRAAQRSKAEVLFISVTAATFVIGISIGAWFLFSSSAQPRLVQQSSMPGDDPLLSMTPREIALGFLNAPTIEEKLRWVRGAEKAEPLMREFYSGRETTVDKFHDLSAKDHGLFIDTVYDRFLFVGENETRFVTVCDTKAGPRVDWETFSQHNPVSWNDFLGETPAEDVSAFRVFSVRSAEYFDDHYPEQVYACYRITPPDLDVFLYGYIKRDSPVRQMFEVFLARKNPFQKGTLGLLDHDPIVDVAIPVILTLRRTDRTPITRQLEIVNFDQVGWMKLE